MMYNAYRFISPEYAALINPVACAAFAMRCEGRADIKVQQTVSTGNTAGGDKLSAQLARATTENAVCDAKLFVTPFIELWNDVTLTYGCEFVNSILNVSIDGEPVIKDSAVNNHLLCPACLVVNQPTSTPATVLLGCDCELALLGMCEMFFLPNGTKISADLSNIPTGGGDLNINFGLILTNYTTKVRQGCLMGVGALDAHQQAVEVHYPCNATFAAPPGPGGGMAAPAPFPTAGPAAGPANVGGGP